MASRDMEHRADKNEWEVATLLRPAEVGNLSFSPLGGAHEPGCWGW